MADLTPQERARETINIEAAASIAGKLLGTGARNKTAETMAKGVAKDVAKETKAK